MKASKSPEYSGPAIVLYTEDKEDSPEAGGGDESPPDSEGEGGDESPPNGEGEDGDTGLSHKQSASTVTLALVPDDERAFVDFLCQRFRDSFALFQIHKPDTFDRERPSVSGLVESYESLCAQYEALSEASRAYCKRHMRLSPPSLTSHRDQVLDWVRILC